MEDIWDKLGKTNSFMLKNDDLLQKLLTASGIFLLLNFAINIIGVSACLQILLHSAFFAFFTLWAGFKSWPKVKSEV